MGWICAFCDSENDDSEKECLVCNHLKSETDAQRAADLAFKRKKEEEEKRKEEARRKEEAKRLAEEKKAASENATTITSMSYMGGTYVGMVLRGVPHGTGNFYKKSGDPSELFVYRGDWVNGAFEGKGTIEWTDGTKYEGEWKAGKREGYGIYHFKNGDRYEGYFKNGVFHGNGIYYYSYSDAKNRKKLEGHWVDDKLEGKTTLWFWDNSKSVDIYRNDVPIHGTYYWKSGDYMEGDYYEGRRNGAWKYYQRGALYAYRTYSNGKQIDVQYITGRSSSSSSSSGCSSIIAILIFLGLVIGGIKACRSCSSSPKSKNTKVEQKATSTYVCTANSLNVRSYASASAPVIGKLTKGQRVEVYQITNNFAKINYSGKTGYVSSKYITPINQYKPSSSATSNKKAAQTTSQTKIQTQTVKPIPADARNLHAGRITKKPRIDKTDGDVYAVTQGPGYTTLWFVVPRFDLFYVSSRTYLIAQNGSQSIKLKIKEMGEWTKDKKYVKFKLDVDHSEDYSSDRLFGLIFDEIDPSITTISIKDEKRNWAWTGIHLNPSE